MRHVVRHAIDSLLANGFNGSYTVLVYEQDGLYSAVNPFGDVLFSGTDVVEVEEFALNFCSGVGGTVLLRDLAFDYSLTVPVGVGVVERLNGLDRVFINSANSQGSPYTISVDTVQSGYYMAQDCLGRIINSWTSTNLNTLITTNLMSALTAGDVVYFNSGAYSGYFAITKAVTITGAKGAVITLPANSDNIPVIDVQASNATVSGFTINGNKANQSPATPEGTSGIATTANNIANVIVEDMTIHDCYDMGVVTGQTGANSNNWVIRNNIIYQCTNGITFAHGFNMFAYENDVSYCSDIGITCYNVDNATIRNNKVHDLNTTDSPYVGGNNHNAFSMEESSSPSSMVTWEGNEVWNVDTAFTNNANQEYGFVLRNVVRDVTKFAWLGAGESNWVYDGNIIRNVIGSSAIQMSGDGTTRNVTIINNYFYGTYSWDILNLGNLNNLTITDNHVFANSVGNNFLDVTAAINDLTLQRNDVAGITTPYNVTLVTNLKLGGDSGIITPDYYDLMAGAPASSAFGTAGNIYSCEIVVPRDIVIRGFIYNVGSTSAGNVTLALYSITRVTYPSDSPVGGSLIVQSDNVAQATANKLQIVTCDNTFVKAGTYEICIMGSDATGTYTRHYDDSTLLVKETTLGDGYGDYPSTYPALDESGLSNQCPHLGLVCLY